MKQILGIDDKEDGSDISFKEEQASKQFIPREVKEDGNSNKTCSNLEHDWKAAIPILVIDEGIFICVNEEHPIKE